MIENIKTLFHQLDNKTDFILLASEDLGKSPNTLRHHWLSKSGFWRVPEEYQPRLVELLQNTLATKNAKKIEVESETVK